MKIVIILLLSIASVFGRESGTQVETQRLTQQINNNNGKFSIDFDLDRLDSMVSKTTENVLQKIKIDIAPGKTVTVVKEHVEIYHDNNNSYSWFGKILDGEGNVVLSVRKGRMVGTVTVGTEHYTITAENDHFNVTKSDPEQMIEVGEDEIISPFKLEKLPDLEFSDTQTEKINKENISERSISRALDGNTSIDVMLLYTKAMKTKYGADTELKIQHLFNLAQKAYIDSKTKVKLNLVYLQQLPDSSTLNDIKPDSNHLNAVASDGYIAYLRRKHHADMVSVISRYTGGGGCGIGLLPKHENDPMTRAFSIVMVRSASEGSGSYCSDMTLAHEMGHNFSCQHDRDHTSGSSIYEYAYGYDVADKFATIMSYDRPKISYFSNPNLIDESSGEPIGISDEEDNARAIRNTRTKIADNSDEIDESLESDDHSLTDGYLNANKDRDAYFITLGGKTSFIVANPKYSNTWGYYINIYNTKTHTYITSCKNNCEMDLDNGYYRVVVSYHNDEGSYYNGSGDHYAIEVSTEYTKPPYPVSVINYLLQ